MSKEQQLVKHLIQSQAFSNVEMFISTSHGVLGDDLKSVLMEKDGRGRPLWFELFAGKPPKSEEDMLSILARMRGGIKALGDIGVDLLGDSSIPYWAQLFQEESNSFFAIDHIRLIYCVRLDEFLRTEFFSFLPEDSIKKTFEQSKELWPLLYERRLTHSIRWIAKIAGINPETSQKVVEIIEQSGSFMKELTHIYNSSNNSRPISPYRQIREFLDLRYRPDKEIKKMCLLFESGKDLLSHEEKREILKSSFDLRNMTLAQAVAKDLGCDIETREGFAKVLPLVEKVGNRTLLNRAFKFKLLDQEIKSDFGQTHGMLFFSKAAKGLGSVYSYRGRKEVSIYGEDLLSKVLGKRELFDFLTAKDSQGNYLSHQERAHSQVIELLLSATLPGDTPKGPNRFWGGVNESLQKACKEEPEKMRTAVEACLFNGNQVRMDFKLAENFWKGLSSMGSPEAWIFHWDVLHENKIITTQELQQLLKTILCPQGEMAEKGLKNFQTYWGKGEEDFVKKKIFLSKVIEIIEGDGGFDLALWKNFDMSVLKKSIGQNQSWAEGRLGEFIPQLELQIERSMLEKATSNIPAYKSTKAPFKI